ncbi:MAG: phytanoyl-CoA dioxygenase family protein [Microscillaceae bacterium]|jgi:ectoine hydroxylase-related dioxygenase (phytanoyl-CoA dioxygenase family)|nr:phytanoyl-CoA dioxygenase family protein [Microscillaceae bacterium]
MSLHLPKSIQTFLAEPYTLNAEQIEYYQTYRYIKLKNVLNAETISFFDKVISEQVAKMNTLDIPLAERSTYGKAFLQLFNLWRENEVIKQLIFSPRLGKIASDLLQTAGVRIYHDQALFKEPGGGITPWHADQYYWPLETDKTITAWLPLQATPLALGPLEFSAGSHQIVEGRELAISDTSEAQIQQKLRVTDFRHVVEPFDLGEVSFHSGWVFHRAGANTTDQMRKVMTIIYMDKAMKLKQPENPHQIKDWHTWCPGAVAGEVIDTPLNPIVYAN